MAITHAFVSAVADGGDATLVRPSNWNADHLVTGLLATTDLMQLQTQLVTGIGETLVTRGPGDRGPGQVFTGPIYYIGSVVIGTPKVFRSNFTIPKDHIHRMDGTITTGHNIQMRTEDNATLETANLNSISRLYTPGRG